MASITKKTPVAAPKAAPAPKAEEATEVVETTPPAKATKAVKEKAPKVEKVAEVDPILGLNRNVPSSFRWIAVDTLRACWPKSQKKEDFDENEAAAYAANLYKERGGDKEITHDVWVKQLKIIRKWLLSKGINKPMPGDSTDRADMTPERKAQLREQLAKGRAIRQAKAAKSADADEAEDA